MFHFFSYISRLKLIDRWSLMRCVEKENVQEHSYQVAVVAHALALIKNKHFGGEVSPERIATQALFHDATEVMTGDLPTPVKYFSPELRIAYKAFEGHAAAQLLKLLPDDLRGDYVDLVNIPNEERETAAIIKAADLLCAYIKCLEEKNAGNKEFSRAQKSIEARLLDLRPRPEVAYFIDHFVPSFTLTLDEMSDPLQI
ncbi:MAG: 5'-deoxynucleotidase [Bdellovibrionia bacterium]